VPEERIELIVKWDADGAINAFGSTSRDDVNGFFRVVAGPGGTVNVNPSTDIENRFAVLVTDALGRPVATADLTVTPPVRRPMPDGPAAWFGG
jgi:hypothetical protein